MELKNILRKLLLVALIVAPWSEYTQAQQAAEVHFLFAPDYGMGAEQLQAYEPLMPALYAEVNFIPGQSVSLDRFSLETRYKELLQLLDVNQLKAERGGIVILGAGGGSTAALTATATNRLAFLKALVVESPIDPLAQALIDYGQELFDKSQGKLEELEPLFGQALSDPAAWYASTPRANTEPLRDVYPISSIQCIGRSLPLLFMIQRNDIFYQKNTTRLLYIKLKQAGYSNVYLLDLDNMLDANAAPNTYVAAVHAFYKKYNMPCDNVLAIEGQQYLAQAQPFIKTVGQTILRSYEDTTFAQKVLLALGGVFAATKLGNAVVSTLTKAIKGSTSAPPSQPVEEVSLQVPQVPKTPHLPPQSPQPLSKLAEEAYNKIINIGPFIGVGRLSEAGVFVVPMVPQLEIPMLSILQPGEEQPMPMTASELHPMGHTETHTENTHEQILNNLGNNITTLETEISRRAESAHAVWLKKMQEELAAIEGQIQALPPVLKKFIEAEVLNVESAKIPAASGLASLIRQIGSKLANMSDRLTKIRQELESIANKALMEAARRGDIRKVDAALLAGADVNYADEHGNTALTYASDGGHEEIVRLLLERRTDVDQAARVRTAALMEAAEYGDTDTVKLLIELGADVNRADRWGSTALTLATERGYAETVKVLVELGAGVNYADNEGDTALAAAAIMGYTKIVRLLIEHGAHVNHADKDSNTALMWTTYDGRADIARLLVEHGAIMPGTEDFQRLAKLDPIWQPDAKQQSATLERVFKSNSLAHAIAQRDINRVLEFLSAMAQPDMINSQDAQGFAALHWAAAQGQADIVAALLDSGANFRLTNVKGLTPYQLAERNRNERTAGRDTARVKQYQQVMDTIMSYDGPNTEK